MSKNFEDYSQNPENYSKYTPPRRMSGDPNLITNGIVYNEISGSFVQSMIVGAQAVMSLITAPLTTMQVSLQLSVLPHKNIYGDVSGPEANKLINIPKEITVQDRRRYELLIKSGATGTNKPFRAPVYASYAEVFEALSKQGFLGFYKGNLLGIIHSAFHSYLRFEAFYGLEYSNYRWYHQGSFWFKSVVATTFLTAVDTMCHPIQLMQSRFILQNRLQNFYIYKSPMHFIRKNYRQPKKLFLGVGVHLPKNILMAFGRLGVFKDSPIMSYIISNQIANTLIYPLMTALRRIHCQDPAPGMLPLRYSGVWHALKLILKEEGVKGLFRGYAAFTAGSLMMSSMMPSFVSLADQAYDMF